LPRYSPPSEAHGQAEFVGFAGRLAIEAKDRTAPDPRPCISSFSPAWGDDELAVTSQ